jgi:hypothetical protein
VRARPVLELADVLRRHGEAYRQESAGHLGRVERRVMSAITTCHGGAQRPCEAELLRVPYFHVVFTLPPAAAEIAFHNKALAYGLLMRAAAEALMALAGNPKHLGANIGLVAFLHTWG